MQGCIQKFCQGGGEFGVWKKEEARGGGGGGATPYTCYAGMLVSLC